MSLCNHVIMSSCHHVIMSSCHPVTKSPSHHSIVILSSLLLFIQHCYIRTNQRTNEQHQDLQVCFADKYINKRRNSLSTRPRRIRPCSRTRRRSAGWRVYTAAGCGTPTAAPRTPRPPRPRTRPARRTRTARLRPRTRLVSDVKRVIDFVFALQLRESHYFIQL